MLTINLFPEKWRVIPRYEDYAVSNIGRVMRVTEAANSPRASKTYPGKIKALFKSNVGYLCVSLAKNKKGRSYTVASLVAISFLGPCPEGKEINHKNGIKVDNRLENLEYVTRSENALHALALGLKKPAKGNSHANSKLKEEYIFQILTFHKLGYSQKEIAKRFNVHPVTIFDVLHGRAWNWLTKIKQ